jgi:hypothetical protein
VILEKNCGKKQGYIGSKQMNAKILYGQVQAKETK